MYKRQVNIIIGIYNSFIVFFNKNIYVHTCNFIIASYTSFVENWKINAWSYNCLLYTSLEYKETGIDLKLGEPYNEIGNFIKNYMAEPNIENKIKIFKSLRDFFTSRQYINEIDKLSFAENITKPMATMPRCPSSRKTLRSSS